MRTGLGTALGSGLVAAASLLSTPAAPGPRAPAGAPTSASCRICHPAAVHGLELSVHASLLDDAEVGPRLCVTCHGDCDAHVASARRPEDELIAAGAVDPATCKACHQDEAWPTTLGAHPWIRREVIERALLDGQDPFPAPELPEPDGLASFDWDGLIEVGYRFVSRTGSAGRYATDVNLEEGLRLVDGRVTGRGHSAWLDSIELRARDLGDPWERYSAELEKDGLYRATAGHENRVLAYRAQGDYSRVEHESRTTTFGFDVDLDEDLGVYADLARFQDDGVWLTQRIAGRDSPDISVDGVRSPRRIDSDTLEAGLRGVVAETRFRAGFEYLSERHDDRWAYDRPSPGNPQFADTEDFRSVSELAGPGLVLAASRTFDDLELDFDLRHRELDRDVQAGGVRTGYDSTAFETTTTANAGGEARTTWIEAGAVAHASDEVTFLFDLSWRDHTEEMHLLQTEVTRFPVAGGGVTVVDDFVQRTSQRRLSGSLELEAELVDGLVLGGGWGFSREELSLPDLVAGDADPTSGTIRDNGAILGAEWRPDDAWRVRLRYTDFGQSGLQLYEPQEDEARTADVSLRYREGSLTSELFYRHRRARNDASAFRSSWDSYGATVSLDSDDAVDLFASYVLTDTDSQTLSTFYFDPDPAPVPTVVGFTGRTHTGVVGVDLDLAGRLRWRNDVALTDTTGSFDVRTASWRSALSYQVAPGGRLSLRYDLIDYAEGGGRDDFHADMVLLTWRQEFGGSGR